MYQTYETLLRNAVVGMLILGSALGWPCEVRANPPHEGVVTAQMITPVAAWGATAHVVAADNMYFAGQPDAAGFAAAAQAGVTAVINIRGAKEVDWDIATAVTQAGMTYHNEPLILDKQGIDEASVRRITQLVDAAGDGKVLVHCSSGNRVAIWWAVHLVRDHHMATDAAIALAQVAGMKPALAQMLQSHLQ